MGHADTRMLERVYGKLSPEELSRRLLLHARSALPDCIANASVGTEFAGISRQAGHTGIANPGIGAQGRNRTTDTGIFSPRQNLAFAERVRALARAHEEALGHSLDSAAR